MKNIFQIRASIFYAEFQKSTYEYGNKKENFRVDLTWIIVMIASDERCALHRVWLIQKCVFSDKGSSMRKVLVSNRLLSLDRSKREETTTFSTKRCVEKLCFTSTRGSSLWAGMTFFFFKANIWCINSDKLT